VKGLIVAALLFPIAGCVAGRRPLAECFLFGLGVAGTAMFVLGLLHVPFVVTIALVVVVGLLGCLVSWAPSNPATQKPSILARLMMIIPLLLLAIPAGTVPLNDFDGRGFWLLKAKALAHERTIDGPFFHNAVVDDPRNQYPLLIPLDAAAVMMAAGDSDDRQVRWLYLFTFAALVFYIGRRTNPWCAAILAWTPQFALNIEGGALTAYSDIAFAAFVACAFFEMLDARSPLRFGMWLSFLVLTKNEGLPVAIVLAAIGIASFRRQIVRSIAPAAIAAVALFVWRAGIPKTDEEDYLALLPNLPARLGRIVPAVIETGKQFFATSSWGLLWIAVWIAIMVLAVRREWRAPAAFVSILAVYIGAYVITNWHMVELIDASADRLLMHLVGPALFAIARAIDSSGQNRYGPPEYQLRSA
jgi:hypothetical protein